ncbi:MAG: hypothetical protein L0956_06330, partial [Candidatus Mariimomonas ferrooxydans]
LERDMAHGGGLPESEPVGEPVAGINGKIVFTIMKSDMDKDFIDRFYEIVKMNPGEFEIEFKVIEDNGKDSQKSFRLSSDYKINMGDDFLGELKKNFPDKVTWSKK